MQKKGRRQIAYCARRRTRFNKLEQEGWKIPDQEKVYFLYRDSNLPDEAREERGAAQKEARLHLLQHADLRLGIRERLEADRGRIDGGGDIFISYRSCAVWQGHRTLFAHDGEILVVHRNGYALNVFRCRYQLLSLAREKCER